MLAAASAAGAGVEAPSYGRDIGPILARRCFVCHGPDESTREARLRLDTADGSTRKRGRRPAVIVPGSPDESPLWQRLTTSDLDDRMPPHSEGHEALPPDELALLRAWIEAGAPYETHWSWQDLAVPPIPQVQDAEWPAGDIDRYVLSRLEREGLSPAPQADPAARLRRLHHDLSGLPPDPAAVRAFLDDPSPMAWEAHVDRLLAAPGFGETWARHWLDLVRYAETHGHEFDYPIDEAWRYRDWVIAAINANMPWDQFVREQIAGDMHRQQRSPELPGVPPPVVATGWWWLSQGTHGPVDVRMDELDRIDNQVDVFGRTFLGATMACARCHDHKFDAITQRDYYAMAGVIRSSRRAYAYLDPGAQLARAVDGLDLLQDVCADQLPSETLQPLPSRDPVRVTGAAFTWDFGDDPEAWSGWTNSGWSFRPRSVLRPGDVVFAGKSGPRRVGTGQVHSAVMARGLHGTARSPSFTIEQPFVHVLARGDGSRIRVYIDHYWLNDRNELLFETMIQDLDHPDTWQVHSIDVSRYLGHHARVELIDDGDGFVAVDWIAHGGELPEHLADPVPVDLKSVQLSTVHLERLARLDAVLPAPTRALAMVDGSPADSPLLIRGDPGSPGAPAPRGLAAAFPGGEPPEIIASGRLELADRVMDPGNPLTARVAANRAWQHLMGRGLSTTPDDLGGMGEAPSHPELLDHLAVKFKADWNLKGLIKQIAMSRAYSMASTHPDPRAVELDPDGRLLSRAVVRRVSAERLRDAMLAVSGSLDRTMGGPPVPVHLRESMHGRGRPDQSGPIDGNNRRSIYQEVRRNFLNPFLMAFDMPVPSSTSGRRAVSNVPEQGLMMLNDPFVLELAVRFGARGRANLDEGRTRAEIVGDMIAAAYARLPREPEIDLLAASLDDTDDSWTDLAHALLASTEFRYLR